MKKILLALLFMALIWPNVKIQAQTDTLYVNGYYDAMNIIYGSLDTSLLTTNLLINRAPADSTFYFFDGKKDSVINYLSFLLHYNSIQLAQQNNNEANSFLQIDSAARSKPYIPLGLMYYAYEFISDAALSSGNLSLVNGTIINAATNFNPFQKSIYFSSCPMNFIATESNIFRLDSNFIFTNKNLSNATFLADFNDGLGIRAIAMNMDYIVDFNYGNNSIALYLVDGSDTLKSTSTIFLLNTVGESADGKSSGMCNYKRPDIPVQTITADPNYGLIKEGIPTGRYAVWLGCGNDNNGSEENSSADIRKPYIVSAGFNPLYGKALDPCSPSDLSAPNPFNLILQFGIASAVSGLISATSAGIINIPAFAELATFLYETNFYGGWRGPIYETYNGTYNNLFSPNDPKNEDNRTNYFEKLREEGYDIVIVTYNNPVDYIENNAAVMISLIKQMNNQLRLNGSKHELVVGGYSAGALTSRVALAEMERYYNFNKGTSNEGLYPHPHTRLFMSVEGEYQGANTPIGFQHLVNYLCKSPATTPIEIMEILLANLTRKQFSNHTAKELSIMHYDATINGNSANQNPERDNFVLLQSQIGYPQSCRKVGISQGSGLSKGYQDIDPAVPMFHIRSEHRTGIPPIFSVGYYREYASNYTPTNSTLAVLATRAEGISFTLLGNSVYMNLINNFNNGHTYIYNSKPYDECPGSLLAADKTFDQAGAKFLFGTLSWLTNPFSSNTYHHQGTKHSFAPTVSTLDLHNPLNPSQEADLYFNPVANGLMKSFQANGQLINSANRDFGYPHISYPNNHYAITPFDAIWAVGDNTKADNHFHVEDPQPLMCDFMVGEVAPEHLYLSNRFINEPLLAYSFFNNQTGTNEITSKYQAAFDTRRKIFCGNDVYYIVSQNKSNLILPTKELSPNGDFIVGENGDVEFTAGEEINLMPGFEAKAGSNFTALITTHNCSNAYEIYRVMKTEEGNTNSTNTNRNCSLDSDDIQDQTAKKYKVFPTPASDRIEIGGIIEDEVIEITLLDMFGKKICSKQLWVGNNSIFLNQFQNGLYVLSIKKKGKLTQTEKILIQHS